MHSDFNYQELTLLLEWCDCALYFDDLTPEDKELKLKIINYMDGNNEHN